MGETPVTGGAGISADISGGVTAASTQARYTDGRAPHSVAGGHQRQQKGCRPQQWRLWCSGQGAVVGHVCLLCD